MWNSRNTLEVASNHYSIRHKLLTVCSPPKQSNKICRPHYEVVPRNTFQMKQARFAVVLWHNWQFPASGRGYLVHLLLGFCVLAHLLFGVPQKAEEGTCTNQGPSWLSLSSPLCPAGPECWVIITWEFLCQTNPRNPLPTVCGTPASCPSLFLNYTALPLLPMCSSGRKWSMACLYHKWMLLATFKTNLNFLQKKHAHVG